VKTDGAHAEKEDRRVRRAARRQERFEMERELGLDPKEPSRSPVPKLESRWFLELRETFPEMEHAKGWSLKQKAQVKRVVDLYAPDQVELAIVFLIKNWKSIRDRMFKGKGDALPGVGVLAYFHEKLVPNAELWNKHRATLEEYRKYDLDRNPYAACPPDLKERYAEATKELAALGLA
jgi:hypothetical protein